MADHLFRKPRGMLGTAAIAVAVLASVLLTPRPALADAALSATVSQASIALSGSPSSPAVSVSVPAVSVQAPVVAASAPDVSVSAHAAAAVVPAVSASVPAVAVSVPAIHMQSPSRATPVVTVAASAAVQPAAGSPAAVPSTIAITATGRVHNGSAARTRPRPRAARTAARHSHPSRAERVARNTPEHAAATAASAPRWSQDAGPAAPAGPETLSTHPAHSSSRGVPRRALHRAVRPVPDAASTAPVMILPATTFLPPAGSGGTMAGGAAAAAGAGAAVLLLLIALYGMRALLPGLLALGPGRWQSALLVCRLERPG